MPIPDSDAYAAIRAALDAAEGAEASTALPELRAAADLLTGLIDDALAASVLQEGASLRAAGAAAGLTENAVGPRLARTSALAAYPNQARRVTGSEREAWWERAPHAFPSYVESQARTPRESPVFVLEPR